MESINRNDETAVSHSQPQEQEVQQQPTTMGNRPSTSTPSGSDDVEVFVEDSTTEATTVEVSTTVDNGDGGGHAEAPAPDNQHIQQPETNISANNNRISDAEEGGNTTTSHGQQNDQANTVTLANNQDSVVGEGGDASGGSQHIEPAAMASKTRSGEKEEEEDTNESTQTDETNNVMNIDDYPVITNFDEAPVSFGKPDGAYRHLLYCGRSRGDNRWCGPDEGRQCASCIELQRSPKKKMDMLQLVFPAITENIFVAALREKRGDVYHAAQYLIDLGAPHIPLQQAFPRFVSLGSNDTAPLRVVDAAQVAQIQSTMGYSADDEIKRKVVESALRRQENHRDPQDFLSAAFDYLFETDEQVLHQNVVDDEAQQSTHEEEQLAKAVQRINVLMDRNREIERVKQMPVPDSMQAIAIQPFSENSEPTTREDCSNGHCMMQYTNTNVDDDTAPFCDVCACQPPGRFAGTSLCRTCGLCEGCLSSNVVFHCPSIGNGCHLHPHPLQRLHIASSRRGNRCSVRGEGCLEDANHHGRYVCERCDFNVCKNCISKDAPTNFDRRRGRIVDPPEASPEQQQNTTQDIAPLPNGPRFDSSERRAAAQWGEGMQVDEDEPPFVVGTGQVGLRAPTRRRQNSSTTDEEQRRTGTTGRADIDTLNSQNIEALETFSNSVNTAACDIHHVEHILLLAQNTSTCTTGHSSNIPLAIRQAVTAGKVGIAGTFLLANLYAPKKLLQKRKNRTEDGMVCFCGGVVDLDTAPDGAVGCLNGHGMHAGCAADHVLGGGGCPFCNSPLFFPNIPPAEVEAAKELARTKLEKRKKHIETETAARNIELSAQGLDISPKLNDVVRISADIDLCASELTKYAERCGWNPCMQQVCGLTGRVSQVLDSGDTGDERKVAYRVHIDNNPDYQYFWTPSVLTVVCRVDSNEYVLFKEANITEIEKDSERVATANADSHISRLQAELKVLVAARLQLEDSTEATTMSSESESAVATERNSDQLPSLQAAKSIVSYFDWCRAKHLLFLADRWGDSEKSISARRMATDAIREGDIDSASRIIRRYNAMEVGEYLQWKDASVSEGREYLVEKFAKVDLLAWPSAGAPKTGYSLEPSTRFFSRAEITDDDGNLWLQVDDTVLATLPKYEGLPPPQGWVCTKPGGSKFPETVRPARSALRCFGCGDGLVPIGRQKTYFAVKPDHGLCEGDDLLVAATLEPVQVVSLEEEGNVVVCSFSNQSNSHQKKQKASMVGQCNFTARYRRDDLVYPGWRGEGMGQNHNEEERDLKNDDFPCSRRDLIRKYGGDAVAARKAWENAKNSNICGIIESDSSSFASCVRGHLLHSRCFQAALLAGQSCPAPGCAEPLWVPRVRRRRIGDDTTCCGSNGTNVAVDGDDGDENAGLTTFINSRRTPEDDLSPSTLQGMKMCPLCYSGPFIHTKCSDMERHHGQCVRTALGGENCGFSVQHSDIATILMGLSPNESIVTALPKCPDHGVPVMFNGCLNCGHVFAGTDWDDLPTWDPSAKAVMKVDKEKREQAKILADHIREEASILQFDRDALENTWGKAIGTGQENTENAPLLLPPVPPPADYFL